MCCCETCTLKIPAQDLLGPIGQDYQRPAAPSQFFGVVPGAENTGLPVQSSTPSFDTSTSFSLTPYNQTASGISQYNSLFNSSMRTPYSNSSLGFNSSIVGLPSAYSSWNPSLDQSFSSHLPDRPFYQPRSNMTPARQSDLLPQQISGFKNLATQRAESNPSCTDFLRTQRRLHAEFKDDVMAIPEDEKQFAVSIGVSTAELRFCVSARRHLLPHIENILSSSYGMGLPADYTAECKFLFSSWGEQFHDFSHSVVCSLPMRSQICTQRWVVTDSGNVAGYKELHSAKQRPDRGLHDSAYQSQTSAAKNPLHPGKKRKRLTKSAEGPKQYQCTRIKSDGTYCLKENIHVADCKYQAGLVRTTALVFPFHKALDLKIMVQSLMTLLCREAARGNTLASETMAMHHHWFERKCCLPSLWWTHRHSWTTDNFTRPMLRPRP